MFTDMVLVVQEIVKQGFQRPGVKAVTKGRCFSKMTVPSLRYTTYLMLLLESLIL